MEKQMQVITMTDEQFAKLVAAIKPQNLAITAKEPSDDELCKQLASDLTSIYARRCASMEESFSKYSAFLGELLELASRYLQSGKKSRG